MTAPLENGTFKVSNSIYPLTADTTNSALLDADPVLYWLLDYFQSQLQTYAGARWAAECARCGVVSMPQIVGQTMANSPGPFYQDSSVQFPLLAIYRTDGTARVQATSYDLLRTKLELIWVMSPLTLSQTEVLGPFRNSVVQIISDRSHVGSDPNYRSGFNWFGPAGGNGQWIQLTTMSQVELPGADTTSLPFQGIALTLQLDETNFPVPGAYEPLTGADTALSMVADDATIPLTVSFDTDLT